MQNRVNRSEQPVVVIPQGVDMPSTEQRTLGNGVRLYALDNSDQQVVRLSFVFRAGSSLQQVPFSASTTANMLAEGTELYTAHQIAESLDFVGSYFDVNIDRDYAVITFCALKRFLGQTLDVAAQVILAPTFPQEEISTYAAKRKQRLSVERSKVGFRARELFTATLFGSDHPYGVSSSEECYDDLTRNHIVDFYKQCYTAENCFVVCSGDLDSDVIDRIAHVAGQIGSSKRFEHELFVDPSPSRYAFAEQKGAVQSAIRIGKLLFTRQHPDYVAMQVTTTVLGGYFGSRLVKNLREECGYTYGIFAAMVNMEQSGYMAIATEVATAVTEDSVRRIMSEIGRLRTELVPEQELQMVKNIVTGEVMRVMDGPFGVADVTIENIQNSDDNSYINRFLEEVRAITPERIQQVAQQYLDPEEFTIAIVGDSSADVRQFLEN